MTHVITGYRTTLSSVICKLDNSISQSSVCLVRCFHSGSFRVRCSIRALPSLPHFINSFSRHLISFSESCSTATHCKGASRSPVILANSFLLYRWTGSSSKPLLDTSLRFSWCSLQLLRATVALCASLLVSSSKSLSRFPQIVVLQSRSSWDLGYRPFDSLCSASPSHIAQSFRQAFATCNWRKVNIKRTYKKGKRIEQKHKESIKSRNMKIQTRNVFDKIFLKCQK